MEADEAVDACMLLWKSQGTLLRDKFNSMNLPESQWRKYLVNATVDRFPCCFRNPDIVSAYLDPPVSHAKWMELAPKIHPLCTPYNSELIFARLAELGEVLMPMLYSYVLALSDAWVFEHPSLPTSKPSRASVRPPVSKPRHSVFHSRSASLSTAPPVPQVPAKLDILLHKERNSVSGSQMLLRRTTLTLKRAMHSSIVMQYTEITRIELCKRHISGKLGIRFVCADNEVEFYFSREEAHREFMVEILEFLITCFGLVRCGRVDSYINAVCSDVLRFKALYSIVNTSLDELSILSTPSSEQFFEYIKNMPEGKVSLSRLEDLSVETECFDPESFYLDESISEKEDAEIPKKKKLSTKLSHEQQDYEKFNVGLFRYHKNGFRLRYAKFKLVSRNFNRKLRSWEIPSISGTMFVSLILLVFFDLVGFLPSLLCLALSLSLVYIQRNLVKVGETIRACLLEEMVTADPKTRYYLDKDPTLNVGVYDLSQPHVRRNSFQKKWGKTKYKIIHRSKALRSIQHLFIRLDTITARVEALVFYDQESTMSSKLVTIFGVAWFVLFFLPFRVLFGVAVLAYFLPECKYLRKSKLE